MSGGATRWVAYAASRLAEVLLVGLGLFFVVADEEQSLDVLFFWDLLALLYLAVGFAALRRSRLAASPGHLLRPPRGFPGRRFNFCFSAVASLVGALAAVISVLYKDDEYVQLCGAVAMFCSWMLLHAGYGRMYSGFDPAHGGLAFPGGEEPDRVDYMYFSYTIGATFASSDVAVTTRRMRWHVMVHSVLSFFFNALVIAIAIGVIKDG
ncbi:DUF1345 domain-containing protein [Actinocorallia longicatena]|uniref:DUF1345 domain-containing protein n=1 Tax=Actinocorallia longicatena TaxID=111803 RepID=A0ABP6Q2M9_9ACTN